MARATKIRKREWHDEMRQRACGYSQGICNSCKKITHVSHDVIHHSAYPAGVYEIDAETLIDINICVWLCKGCHEKIRFTEKIENSSSGKLNVIARASHFVAITPENVDIACSFCMPGAEADAKRNKREWASRFGEPILGTWHTLGTLWWAAALLVDLLVREHTWIIYLVQTVKKSSMKEQALLPKGIQFSMLIK